MSKISDLEQWLFKKDFRVILLFLFLAIIIRVINFSDFLNFSTDQATFSSVALDILRKGDFTLIGPRFTLEYDGRHMFMGPYIYYLQLFFLLLGDFDPVRSSFYFTLFACLMVIPLYFGLKELIDGKMAVFAVLIYSLIPYYINYTRFLWNPNYQFSLIPVLIYLTAFFKKRQSKFGFFILSFFLGFLFQFHYTFGVIVAGYLIYYFLLKRIGYKFLIIFFVGFFLSLSPLIVFELRNNFYNLKTFLIFIEHFNEVAGTSYQSNSASPHYYLSVSFLGIILLLLIVRKFINLKILTLLTAILFIYDLFSYLLKPANAFTLPKNWNYSLEQKAHQIIAEERLANFNVANLVYDPKAEVLKYLLKRDNILINQDDYKNNKYLFVLTPVEKDYLSDPAYEIKSLHPAKHVKEWRLNKDYILNLARRE